MKAQVSGYVAQINPPKTVKFDDGSVGRCMSIIMAENIKNEKNETTDVNWYVIDIWDALCHRFEQFGIAVNSYIDVDLREVSLQGFVDKETGEVRTYFLGVAFHICEVFPPRPQGGQNWIGQIPDPTKADPNIPVRIAGAEDEAEENFASNFNGE